MKHKLVDMEQFQMLWRNEDCALPRTIRVRETETGFDEASVKPAELTSVATSVNGGILNAIAT